MNQKGANLRAPLDVHQYLQALLVHQPCCH